MFTVVIDLGSFTITVAVQKDLKRDCLSDCSLRNVILHDYDRYVIDEGLFKMEKYARNCFLSVTHLLSSSSLPWSSSLPLPSSSSQCNNFQRKEDGDLVFSVHTKTEDPESSDQVKQLDLLMPLISHLKQKLEMNLETGDFDVSIVLPKSLQDNNHVDLLRTAFSNCGMPLSQRVISVDDALIAAYFFKVRPSSKSYNFGIIDIGHLLTKMVIFDSKTGANLESQEWWFGAEDLDRMMFEYCLSQIPPDIREKMNHRSNMKLLNACSKAKRQVPFTVTVDDLVGHLSDFEFEIPNTVLHDFCHALQSKLYEFQSKLDRSRRIKRLIPVGGIASLEAVRTAASLVFNVSIQTPLDPKTDVALGALDVISSSLQKESSGSLQKEKQDIQQLDEVSIHQSLADQFQLEVTVDIVTFPLLSKRNNDLTLECSVFSPDGRRKFEFSSVPCPKKCVFRFVPWAGSQQFVVEDGLALSFHTSEMYHAVGSIKLLNDLPFIHHKTPQCELHIRWKTIPFQYVSSKK
ncbi:hypothetical protein GEMRC1_006673 [Eukaryota sp. GEM-RC1]